MDKLRAIQYFNQIVESGSFAAAARALEVSTPAVTQLVAALERSLGFTLLNRTTRSLSLTADGERYHETTRKAVANLRDIEQRLGQRGAKPRGTLTVGMRPILAQNCIMPRITRFITRYPDIELVFRRVGLLHDIDQENVDVAVMVGWPPKRELIVRPLAQTRSFVCASPEYWAREGRPQKPEDLRDHHCLLLRSTASVLLDRWTFDKDGERRVVNVQGRLFSDDRLWLDEAACAGAGVIRITDLTSNRYFGSGLLVPVLTDWESMEAPTIFAVYRPSQRRSKLIRVFLDFLTEVFSEIEAERSPAPTARVSRVPKPEWFERAHGRNSAYLGGGRRAAF